MTDERRHRAGPSVFGVLLGNRAPPLGFLLLASRSEQDSRRTRGLKSACRCVQRKSAQAANADGLPDQCLRPGREGADNQPLSPRPSRSRAGRLGRRSYFRSYRPASSLLLGKGARGHNGGRSVTRSMLDRSHAMHGRSRTACPKDHRPCRRRRLLVRLLRARLPPSRGGARAVRLREGFSLEIEHKCEPPVELESFVDRVEVILDGPLGHAQLRREFLVAEPAGRGPRHLQLPPREPAESPLEAAMSGPSPTGSSRSSRRLPLNTSLTQLMTSRASIVLKTTP